MGRVDALAAVRGLTADGGDGRVWSLASRWGARMIDAFGLRRIIVAGGFGVIGSSFVHHMVREDPARR